MTTIGRWSPNKVRKRVLDGTWADFFAGNGMVLMEPTSATTTGSGSSATINSITKGTVEFSACTGLSLNDIFTADYDNYMIFSYWTSPGTTVQLSAQLSSNGVASSTGYTQQSMTIDGTSETASRSSVFYFTSTNGTLVSGILYYVYGPYLAQPTAMRRVSVRELNTATIIDVAHTHSVSSSYDGIKFTGDTSTFSGAIAVYGLEN